jgi:hypothetical protein
LIIKLKQQTEPNPNHREATDNAGNKKALDSATNNPCQIPISIVWIKACDNQNSRFDCIENR